MAVKLFFGREFKHVSGEMFIFFFAGLIFFEVVKKNNLRGGGVWWGLICSGGQGGWSQGGPMRGPKLII